MISEKGRKHRTSGRRQCWRPLLFEAMQFNWTGTAAVFVGTLKEVMAIQWIAVDDFIQCPWLECLAS